MKIFYTFFVSLNVIIWGIILFSCNSKDESQSKPFSKFNEEIILDCTDEEKQIQTFDNIIDTLIYSKINTLPLYDSLPFGVKIGESLERVNNKLQNLDLKTKFIYIDFHSK